MGSALCTQRREREGPCWQLWETWLSRAARVTGCPPDQSALRLASLQKYRSWATERHSDSV